MRNKKPLVLVLALFFLIGIVGSATLAWLTDATGPVRNTFETSDIDIELEETLPSGYQAQIVPGYTIAKDPKVTVKANSEKCFLFVTVKENNWPVVTETDGATRKVDYDIAEGWTELEASGAEVGTTVYWRIVEKGTQDQFFGVLKNDQVTVSGTLTKAEMENITNNFTLEFTAYACQYYKNNTPVTGENADANGTPFTAKEAWDNCKPVSVNSGN